MASLYDKTIELLLDDPRSTKEIAEAAAVNEHWLGKFRQHRFENPGVKTVEKLYDHLIDAKRARDRRTGQDRRKPAA